MSHFFWQCDKIRLLALACANQIQCKWQRNTNLLQFLNVPVTKSVRLSQISTVTGLKCLFILSQQMVVFVYYLEGVV